MPHHIIFITFMQRQYLFKNKYLRLEVVGASDAADAERAARLFAYENFGTWWGSSYSGQHELNEQIARFGLTPLASLRIDTDMNVLPA